MGDLCTGNNSAYVFFLYGQDQEELLKLDVQLFLG